MPSAYCHKFQHWEANRGFWQSRQMYHGVQCPDCRACCKRRANARYGIWNTRSKSVYRSGLETRCCSVHAVRPQAVRDICAAGLHWLAWTVHCRWFVILIENRDLYGITSLYSIVQLSYHVFRKISIVWKKCLTFALGFGILLKLSLRDKRKTEKFDLERLDSSKKFWKKVLDKCFWFWYTK